VGPTPMTTRRTPRTDEISTQTGPTFVTKMGQTGARLDDHTQGRLKRVGAAANLPRSFKAKRTVEDVVTTSRLGANQLK
jgi:hypothetical protein